MATNYRPRPPKTVDAHTERMIAVQACVDPQTLRRYLAGEEVRSTCRQRIVQALDAVGRSELIRAEARPTG